MAWWDFYEDEHLGNLFGVSGILYGRKGHLGVDFIHGAGVPVRSWTAGTVVVVVKYASLGWTVIVRRSDGKFAGFCHLLYEPAVLVGDRIKVGEFIGEVGSTGFLSTGPHLHATLEPTITIGTQNAIDPLPYIRAAIKTAKSIKPKEATVAKNFVDTSTYVRGAAVKGTRCMTLWEGGRVEVYLRDPANAAETAVSMTAAYGPHVPVSKETFEMLAKPTGGLVTPSGPASYSLTGTIEPKE